MTDKPQTDALLPTILNPPDLPDPAPLGYSTAVIAPAAARLAFVSGQGGFDPSGALAPDFATQLDQALANLAVVLKALGAGPGQVVKLTVFIVDHDPGKLDPLTASVRAMFGARLPAQTLVPVPALAVPGMLAEVEAVVAPP